METKLERVRITVPAHDRQKSILTKESVNFLAKLSLAFEGRRQQCLTMRQKRQEKLDRGELPNFLPETASVRENAWTVAPIPMDLLDRRVEITGPVERKMIINA